jgi:hypothetical protein
VVSVFANDGAKRLTKDAGNKKAPISRGFFVAG